MDMDKLILLDVDGTMADVHRFWPDVVNRDYHQRLLQTGNYPYAFEDISDWNFGPKAAALGFCIMDCIDIIHDIWEQQWSRVPLTDLYVPESIDRIVAKHGAVDIVTADKRPDEIRQWLSLHSIPYRNFLFGKDDAKLQYKILIEDNPLLPGKISPEQTLLLRDRPWNRDVKERDNVIRFHYSWELPDLVEKALKR